MGMGTKGFPIYKNSMYTNSPLLNWLQSDTTTEARWRRSIIGLTIRFEASFQNDIEQ
jgi:hypothetical protein